MFKNYNSIFSEIFGEVSNAFSELKFNETLVGKDTDKGRVWEVEVPGVKVADIIVESSNDMIYVKATRKTSAGVKTYDYSIPLEGLDPAVVYKLNDGILQILAKKTKLKPEPRKKATLVQVF